MASRSTPYVNTTFDFDCFAGLSLPTTLSVSASSPMRNNADAMLNILLGPWGGEGGNFRSDWPGIALEADKGSSAYFS